LKKIGLFSILVAAALLTFAVITEAQQAKKIPRIGYLSNTDQATESTRFEGIRLELHEVGYIEGEKIAIEYRYADRTAKNHKNNKPRDKVTAL